MACDSESYHCPIFGCYWLCPFNDVPEIPPQKFSSSPSSFVLIVLMRKIHKLNSIHKNFVTKTYILKCYFKYMLQL